MSIGLCCQYLEPIVKKSGTVEYKNILGEKNLQYGQYINNKYSLKDIKDTWIQNVNNLFTSLIKIHQAGFKLFRVSSNLFPLYDSLTQELNDSIEVKNILKKIGHFAIQNSIRLTCHPDQFVVISSNNQEVINKSIKMLEHHAWIFDNMDLPYTPYYAINIHGGAKGNSDILINSILSLKDNVKSRLTLENDERSYSVSDLFKVYQQTQVPILYDSHHHSFNEDGLSSEKAFELSCNTWASIKPLTHLSNTDPALKNGSFTERRKHSDYVHYIPDYQFDANNQDQIDIEFEFKMKNLAIKKAVQDFGIKM